MPVIGILLLGLSFLPGSANAQGQKGQHRLWKDASGRFTITAKFVRFIGNEVELEKQDGGKKITVPIKSLSAVDIAYLKKIAGGNVRRNEAPKGMPPNVIRERIASRLAGKPLPAGQIKLADFQQALSIPVYIDQEALERIGMKPTAPVKLSGAHKNLQDQLDAALLKINLSWCALQTVLVLSTEDRMEDKFAETRFYRIPTPRYDFRSVIRRIQEVEPDTWAALGGAGDVVPVGSHYAIRQSPRVHRELMKALKKRPAPRRYEHPFDSKSVTLAAKNVPLEDVFKLMGRQLGMNVEFSGEIEELGVDLSSEPCNLTLENVSVKDALDLLCGQVFCTWVEQNGGLLITSEEAANRLLTSKRFTVSRGPKRDANSVMEFVLKCVLPDEWEALGGEGTIKSTRPGQYVVRQGQPAMREVERFFLELKSLR